MRNANDLKLVKTSKNRGGCKLASVIVAVGLAFGTGFAARAALPSGYTELPYVASTGTEFFDTEVAPKSKTHVVCDFRYVSLPTAGADKRAYCGWGSGDNQVKVSFLFGLSWNASGSACEFSAYVGAWDKSSTGVPADTQRHVFDLKSGAMYLDGTRFSTTDTLYDTALSSHTMYLFASHLPWPDTRKDYACAMEIYSCKIYDGDTLVRDFVPALRADDSAKGFYDLQNARFMPLFNVTATYFICSRLSNNDDYGCSSIDGSTVSTNLFPRGWAETRGGAQAALGITEPNAFYRIGLDNCWTLAPTNGSYATPASSGIVVEENRLWGLANYLGKNATLTLNNVTLEAGSTFAFSDVGRGGSITNTLDGSFSLAGDSCFQYRGRNRAVDFTLAATVTGTGEIEAFSYIDANVGWLNPRITGDLTGFKGDLVVYNGATNINSGAANGAATTFALELAGAASIPGNPDAGNTARVVVTNGAVLMIDHDWNASEHRVWDFGDGMTPTIYVAEGKTVTINGEIFGTVGFNKAGPGTLVLVKAPYAISGQCTVLSGKVLLMDGAHGFAELFRRKDSLALPDGYTMLESLSLAGGAQSSYIDTGYTPTNGFFGCVFDYSLATAPGSSGGRVMGTSRYNSGQWGGLVLSSWAGSASSSGQFGFGAVSILPAAGGQVANTRMRLSLMNGNAELSRGWRQNVGVATPSRLYGSVYLGNVHCDSMANGQPITLYRFMVFDGHTLVHDFVPVKNGNGTVGIYDTVGDLGFRAAAAAQYCTAGADYDSSTDSQWLEFSGNPDARVVVTNGATLTIARDVTTSENQVWDFGDGLTPTIYVAEGKTLTINGTILGSCGFNKAGPGTLVITRASYGLSGLCNVLGGKVCLKKTATSLAGLFPRKRALALPAGYTMLESLSLAGGAQNSYIDTGCTPANNGLFGCIFDYRLSREPGSSGGRLMGTSRYNSGRWGGLIHSSWAGSANVSGQFGFGRFYNMSAEGGQVANTRMRVSYVNGNVELSRGWRQRIGIGGTSFINGSIYLGNIHTDSMGNGQPITVYRFMVFNGNTLVHDFVPVTNENGVVGVYDAVGNLGFRAAAAAQYCTAGAVYVPREDTYWLEVDPSGVVILFR